MNMLTTEEIGIVILSAKVALWSVLLSVPFALVASHVLSRRDFPGKSLLDAIVHLPLVLLAQWVVKDL